MGPVNWLAVALAALVATGLRMAWQAYFRDARSTRIGPLGTLVVMGIAAIMLGHNYARLAGALMTKPWLYWMQSGGLAIAFVIPALWLVLAQASVSRVTRGREAMFWVMAYLAMGTVFWGLRHIAL